MQSSKENVVVVNDNEINYAVISNYVSFFNNLIETLRS